MNWFHERKIVKLLRHAIELKKSIAGLSARIEFEKKCEPIPYDLPRRICELAEKQFQIDSLRRSIPKIDALLKDKGL